MEREKERDSEKEGHREMAAISDVTERGSPVSLSKKRGTPVAARVSVFGFPRNIFMRARRGTSFSLARFFHILVLFLGLFALSTQIRRIFGGGCDAHHIVRETRRTSYPMTENSQCGGFWPEEKYFHAYRPWITSAFKSTLVNLLPWNHVRRANLKNEKTFYSRR